MNALRQPVRRNTGVADNELADGGGVLLHLESGSYHGLNGTAWAIWQLIDGERTAEEIAAELRARLEDPPDQLDDEVGAFLDGMRARDLIE